MNPNFQMANDSKNDGDKSYPDTSQTSLATDAKTKSEVEIETATTIQNTIDAVTGKNIGNFFHVKYLWME